MQTCAHLTLINVLCTLYYMYVLMLLMVIGNRLEIHDRVWL